MLVLLRHPGQAIVLDGGIRIVVKAVRGDRVTLGIEAPPEVSIVREELLVSVEAETREAAAAREALLARLLPGG